MLPSSKSCRESAAPSTQPTLQSRGISKISVVSVKHCLVKYMWWLLNFSIRPGKFNTTASATSSKRHTFWHLLCFVKGRKGLLPVRGLFLFQFSRYLHNTTHTWFNCTKAAEMWTLTELAASYQGNCVAITVPCNQNLLQGRCGCWQHFWQGYFKKFK